MLAAGAGDRPARTGPMAERGGGQSEETGGVATGLLRHRDQK